MFASSRSGGETSKAFGPLKVGAAAFGLRAPWVAPRRCSDGDRNDAAATGSTSVPVACASWLSLPSIPLPYRVKREEAKRPRPLLQGCLGNPRLSPPKVGAGPVGGTSMPLQNRVTPLGELIAHPARGLVFGNRGCLHDENGRIRRRYAGKRWIACRLQFRGWQRRPLMQPGRYTELFFLDDATAFAAGHRPCATCRRQDYDRLAAVWRKLYAGQVGADAIDAQLHSERLAPGPRTRLLHEAPLDDLPTARSCSRTALRNLVLGAER